MAISQTKDREWQPRPSLIPWNGERRMFRVLCVDIESGDVERGYYLAPYWNGYTGEWFATVQTMDNRFHLSCPIEDVYFLDIGTIEV